MSNSELIEYLKETILHMDIIIASLHLKYCSDCRRNKWD